MDLRGYRPNFAVASGHPVARTRLGTHAEAQAAQGQRTQRIYLALLDEAGIRYTMVGRGQMALDDRVDMDLVAQLWNDAVLLVCHGRDLH